MTETSPLPPLTLVLGGQRSGKSLYAENLLHGPGVYLATGHATDPDMAERIEAHQERRGEGWITVEEPLDLERALKHIRDFHPGQPVLLDSLGMWVSNMLHDQRTPLVDCERVVDAMVRYPEPVVAVSEEVGLGVIPMNELARSFVDALGFVNQITATHAGRVVLVVAGLAQTLKSENA